MKRHLLLLPLFTILSGFYSDAAAQYNRLCDPAYENCRTPIIELIRNETVGIDVGFWFMEDTRYATELIRKHQAGVPVRVVFDRRSWSQFGYEGARRPIEIMAEAGIPIREKTGGAGIFHFKTMIFAGQNVVEFSGANYSDEAFVYHEPYTNYIDEVIMFSGEASIVNSFKTRFDDVWTDVTTARQTFADYANVSHPLTRCTASAWRSSAPRTGRARPTRASTSTTSSRRGRGSTTGRAFTSIASGTTAAARGR